MKDGLPSFPKHKTSTLEDNINLAKCCYPWGLQLLGSSHIFVLIMAEPASFEQTIEQSINIDQISLVNIITWNAESACQMWTKRLHPLQTLQIMT